MMKAKKTWVIVTNGKIARMFDYPGRNKALVPLENHVWHAPEVNEFADSQSVTHSRVGHSQHRLAPHNSTDHALDSFAVEIARKLAKAQTSGAFERLVLVAAPKMLGLLRERLDAAVQATIWVEIDKDFTQIPLDELDKALERHLYS